MKGIKGFLPVSMLDWEDKLTAVLFMGGCNFRCPFCHNPDLVLQPEKLDELSWDAIVQQLASKKGWIDGVTVTGGEPTLSPGLDTLFSEIRSMELETKLDTNGYQPETLERLIGEGLLDFIAMDVKAAPGGYSRAAGRNVDIKILNRSIEAIIGSGLPHEFRCTVVPGFVELADLLEIARWIEGAARLTLQQYKGAQALDPALREVRPLPDETLRSWTEGCSEFLPTRLRGTGANALP